MCEEVGSANQRHHARNFLRQIAADDAVAAAAVTNSTENATNSGLWFGLGVVVLRARCMNLTKWLTWELTIWLSVDALQETLTLG